MSEPQLPQRPYADEPVDPPVPDTGEGPRPVLDLPDDDGDGLQQRADDALVDGADPRIAAAVARLDALGEAPPAEHVEVYEDVHRVLQDALADAARGDQQQ